MTARHLLKFLKNLLACSVVPLSAMAAKVPNNVPPWVAQATLVGPSDTNGKIVVSVHLSLNNVSGLRSFIHDLYSPGTTSYGQFLTPQQFRAAYSPSADNIAAVQGLLDQNGLQVTYTPTNGMYVEATGTVGQLKQVFGISQNQYKYQGLTLRSNQEAPTIPDSLASVVSYIEGLDDGEALNQPMIRKRSGPITGAAPPLASSDVSPCSTYFGDHSATLSPGAYQYGASQPWTNCGYTPQQIRAAYGAQKVPWTGAGVRVGIVDALVSPTLVNDVNRFFANHGLPQLTSSNFQQIVVPGTLNYPENKKDALSWYFEQTLDITAVHTMAPGASIVYTGSQNNEGPLDHALIYLIDNGLADIISNSWDDYGSPSTGYVEALEDALMQAAVQGISVVFSTGDDGDGTVRGLQIAQSYWPASSPYVTAVGGTTVALFDATGNKNEWGWSTPYSNFINSVVSPDATQVTGTSWAWPPEWVEFSGSGGGLSPNFAQPDYQQGVVPNALATTTVDINGNPVIYGTPRRASPDIALIADPYSSGALIGLTFTINTADPLANAPCTPLTQTTEYCETVYGGTSLATPLFAGILALTNQARVAQGKGRVGFVNPTLYKLPVGSIGSATPINDILAPTTPMGTLYNAEVTPGAFEVQFNIINSFPTGTTGPVVGGWDSSLLTTPGYDTVTGLGAPNIPPFIAAFTSLP